MMSLVKLCRTFFDVFISKPTYIPVCGAVGSPPGRKISLANPRSATQQPRPYVVSTKVIDRRNSSWAELFLAFQTAKKQFKRTVAKA